MTTEASRKGMVLSRSKYNTQVQFTGNTAIQGCTSEGFHIGLDIQIAEVMQAFGSVRRMCEAGNRIVPDEEDSYVENK